MLERRRMVISMIFAFNLCIFFWRMSWQDKNLTTPLEIRKFNDNGTKLTQWKVQQQQQETIYLSGNSLRHERNLRQSIPLNFSNTTSDINSDNTVRDPSFSKSKDQIPDDTQRLADLTDFRYHFEVSACSKHILALIAVHSAPKNFKKRMLIRETWAGKDVLRLTPLRVIFLFGRVKDQNLQKELLKENLQYADMVQGSFNDNYRNLTYKHIMAFKWFLDKCAHAQLLIKVDDDILVNTPRFIEYARRVKVFPKTTLDEIIAAIDTIPEKTAIGLFNNPERLIFCQRNEKSEVKRTYRSKWHVSFKEYEKAYYPPYCLGYAIVYSSDVVALLYNSAQSKKIFWIDDVYITGMLTQLNGLQLTDISKYLLSYNDFQKFKGNQDFSLNLEFLFTMHGIDGPTIRNLWKLLNLNIRLDKGFLHSTASSSSPPIATGKARKASKRRPHRKQVTLIENVETPPIYRQTITDPILETQR